MTLSVPHRFQTRVVEDGEVVWMERMEKAQQEMQERFLRTQEETREQMTKMMEMMMAMFKGKGVANDPSSQKEPIPQNSQDNTPFPSRFTLPHTTTSHKAYILVILP